ncbi:ZYRO0C10516p [Zygosaccharomyces rouxii]|uniref:ZYRO0C10516p n=1 Tax=Zygosaccharomyces rouxii (strain ATCC 2623 / CBS 732 / NBRC 1130 / NCYC 568 / NRRL Y-229) TaxID=559307 RepID=C5DTQ8_ZYGRC|nr:uncharacterized protein ZYRO0C10516g [Zygosaccharomyces rouxii]KAH9201654.1 hypothetical protein LQ764DRAFT_82083 [Zygosaccharomyces rouxii]CAR27169.1 ZYRO0C10516p [Zygosaccharomyces rouxii]
MANNWAPNSVRPGSAQDEHISKGSYVQRSFPNLRDINHKDFKGLGPTPLSAERPASENQLSRVSLPQLRLDTSARLKNWEELEDFNLEELRDGFFDARFSKAERVTTDEEEVTDTGSSDRGISGLWNLGHSYGSRVLSKVWIDFKNNFIPICKFFIAYFVALVICVDHRSGRWLGHNYRYFLPIAVVIHHPARTIGFQLEMFFSSVIGGVLAMGWSSLAWYISVVRKPTQLHPGGILFASLTLALVLSNWLKELFQRTLYCALTFNIAIIFLHDVSLRQSKQNLEWQIDWDFGMSYLFGMILSLVVCVLFWPWAGNAEIIDQFTASTDTIRQLLHALTNKDTLQDEETLRILQKKMVDSLNVDLSERYRDFANQFTISRLDTGKLINFRNSLTKLTTPLRILPLTNKLLEGLDFDGFYEDLRRQKSDRLSKVPPSKNATESSTPASPPGSSSLFSKKHGLSFSSGSMSNQFNIELLRSTFSKRIVLLIFEMIEVTENMKTMLETLKNFRICQAKKDEIDNLLGRSFGKLRRKLYHLDKTYKEFVKSDFFSQELLSDEDSVDIFLFLRYIRNSAKNMLEVVECCNELIKDSHWRISRPSYPLSRAMVRLPLQSAFDEGASNVHHYFETKRDVDQAFEQLYNSYTSRHKYTKKNAYLAPRAIDHNDFNFHTTQNPWRYKLWKFSTLLVGREMKWTLKVWFVVVFLSLPGWLPVSHRWYQRYQCFWGPLSFYILVNRRFSGRWSIVFLRMACGLIGIFWGWAANQSRHFGSPYVVCTFGGLLVIPCALNYLVYKRTKSSVAALMCFSVIVLEPYSKGKDSLSTAGIWKNTWVTGLAFIIGIAVSVCINWIVWAFKARTELRVSVSSLIGHIGQSYQSVTDRYLYRDSKDDPTEITLALSHIREVRLAQSIKAIEELSLEAKAEPKLISKFSYPKYQRLLNVCEFLFQKNVEARVSGSLFEVLNEDFDNETTRALLSLRRDSVSSVIFNFYILSNCFRSKNKLPKYLPNPALSRKRLFDLIGQFEMQRKRRSQDLDSCRPSLRKNLSTEEKLKEQADVGVQDYEKLHWIEVHGIAFARAFTDITEATLTLVNCAKEILGEDSF